MCGRWLALCLTCCLATTAKAPESPEIRRARREVERVRTLVDAGALPRQQLEEAETTLSEARDQALLGRLLYGSVKLEDLTGAETETMVAAARRLLDRQSLECERAKLLVDAGAMSRKSLDGHTEELRRRRQTLALAGERAGLFRELEAMVILEDELQRRLEEAPEKASEIAERFDGKGVFAVASLGAVGRAYQREFGQALPISANGATALHRSLRFDHRGRVDVALHPDQQEGRWLRRLLERMRIPYLAFRDRVPGKSTGAHIHIGPPSPRL